MLKIKIPPRSEPEKTEAVPLKKRKWRQWSSPLSRLVAGGIWRTCWFPRVRCWSVKNCRNVVWDG